MTTIPFRAYGPYDLRVAEQGHPSDWQNPSGGEYDLLVVGGGPGGMVAALTAIGAGHRVALVERHLTGGTCVNYGCTPSKAIIACARAVQNAAQLGKIFGYKLPDGPLEVDFTKVMERVREMRANTSSFDSVQALTKAGIHIYLGDAVFTGPDAAEVDGRRLSFRSAVIATGTRPSIPAVDGLMEVGFLTNETVFGLMERPRRLAVIGAGPVGCELAQAFRLLGSEVDLIANGNQLLPRDVPEADSVLRKRFERDGIRLHFRSPLQRAERGPNGTKRLTLANGRMIECDEILLGTGRVSNFEGLGLAAAGVKIDTANRRIQVDEYLRTSNAAIFAAGDCCSPHKFTHAAMAMGRLAAQNAFALVPSASKSVNSVMIPWCTYTEPNVAQVGLTPREASDRGIEVDTHRLPLEMIERAVIDGQSEGFAAIYTRRATGRIVGATLVSSHAGETIQLLTTFIQHELPLEALADIVHCYPTQAEVFKRIADNFLNWSSIKKVSSPASHA